MKNNLQFVNNIKIKLIKSNFLDYDNLYSITSFYNPKYLNLISIDIGIDKILKFNTVLGIHDIINYIELVIQAWFNSKKDILSNILTKEELDFILSNSKQLYQKELFPVLSTIIIRF